MEDGNRNNDDDCGCDTTLMDNVDNAHEDGDDGIWMA